MRLVVRNLDGEAAQIFVPQHLGECFGVRLGGGQALQRGVVIAVRRHHQGDPGTAHGCYNLFDRAEFRG